MVRDCYDSGQVVDRQSIINVLRFAFDKNATINYIIKQDEFRAKRVIALITYAIAVCEESGAIFTGEDGACHALIVYPQLRKSSVRSVIRVLSLATNSIGIFRAVKIRKHERLVDAQKPDIDMAHLWFIGTDPKFQGQGYGTSLIRQILEFTDSKQLPVYLETSVPENLRWYRRFGFEVYAELQLEYKLYFMKREPLIF